MVNLSGSPGGICVWGRSPPPGLTHWVLNQYKETTCTPQQALTVTCQGSPGLGRTNILADSSRP